MSKLTARQAEVLALIKTHIEDTHLPAPKLPRIWALNPPTPPKNI